MSACLQDFELHPPVAYASLQPGCYTNQQVQFAALYSWCSCMIHLSSPFFAHVQDLFVTNSPARCKRKSGAASWRRHASHVSMDGLEAASVGKLMHKELHVTCWQP
jgi:hypothetical protein